MHKPTLIQDVTTLRDLCGDYHPHTPYKVQNHLNAQAQNFIRRSPFVLLSTVNQQGETTISPKGGVPDFVGSWQPESWTESIAISWREEIEPNLPPAQCQMENAA